MRGKKRSKMLSLLLAIVLAVGMCRFRTAGKCERHGTFDR